MSYNFNYNKFREIIFELGYKSERDFCRKTNTPRSTYQNLRNGVCDLSTLKRFCGILNCEISDLFPSQRAQSIINETYVLKVKKIAVLSVSSGVGVTTFSVNLAQMLERKRHKTLIVEFGDSYSFDTLELHNKKTKSIPTTIGNFSLEIKRHGNWLDSCRFTNHKNIFSDEIDSNKFNNMDSSDLEMIFDQLVKMNHYSYIVFSCRRFPFQQIYDKESNGIFGKDELEKLADIVLVGIDSSRIKIEKAKLLIQSFCSLKTDIFIAEFMRKKKDWFINTRHENDVKLVDFDKSLYRNYIKEQKAYFQTLQSIASKCENVHMVEQTLTYFRNISFNNLRKSIYETDDSKLRRSVRSYKYEVKNIFDEIESFEREYRV